MLHNSSHWLGSCCGPFVALAHSLEKSTSIFYIQNLHFVWKFYFTTTHIAASSELTGMTETSEPSDEEKDWMKITLNSTRKQTPNDTTGNYCYLNWVNLTVKDIGKSLPLEKRSTSSFVDTGNILHVPCFFSYKIQKKRSNWSHNVRFQAGIMALF